MKTHGHHKVAELAGEPLLRNTFRQTFGTDVPLEAFYMGNWLTDVAQAYDPVAGRMAVDKIDDAVDWTFDNMTTVLNVGRTAAELAGLYKRLDQSTLDDLLWEQRNRTKVALRSLMKSFIEPHRGGPSLYFKLCKNAFFIKAYLKFVHPTDGPPENATKPLRMDMDVFIDIFDDFFTQYWPHDHMDRPALVPTPPPQPPVVPYDSRRPGPAPGTTIEPNGIYTYLLEFAELTAADLADLDLDWAREYLMNPQPASTLRTDLAFQRGLANLGRALHGVEDYFAHSNYIEHAATVMGGAYQPHFYQYDNARYLKRLKRLTPEGAHPDWHDAPDEPHVVTGYFDFRDTVVSLLHIAEEPLMGIMQRQPKDVTLELREQFDILSDPDHADAYYEREGDKLVADLIEVIQTPGKALDNQNNRVRNAMFIALDGINAGNFVDHVTTIIGHLKLDTPADDVNIAYFRNLLRHTPIFNELEDMVGAQLDETQLIRIYSALLLYVRYLLIKREIAGIPMSLLEIIESLLYWYYLPHKAVKKWLKRVVGKEIADRAIFFGKEMLFDAIAADRVGCHSLMSKDHGAEWLYTPMRNCAIAAHYYVVKNLLRWHEYRSISVPPNRMFIDWDDVLRHIMEHPATGVVCNVVPPVPTSLFHTLTEADMQRPWRDIFKEVANQFLPLTLETARTGFDENRIIWGNFPSMIRNMNPKAVNELTYVGIQNPPLATMLLARRIIVPYIKYKLGVADPTKVNPRWYMPLMAMNWKPARDLPAFDMRHQLVYHPTEGIARAHTESERRVRQKLGAMYHP